MGNLFRTGGGSSLEHPKYMYLFSDFFSNPFTFRYRRTNNDVPASLVDNKYIKMSINDTRGDWTFSQAIVSNGIDLTHINTINVKIKQLKITGEYEFFIGIIQTPSVGVIGDLWLIDNLPTILKYRSNMSDGVISANLTSYKNGWYIYIGIRCIYPNNQKNGTAEVLISDIAFE